MQKFQEVKNLLASLEADVTKFYNHNNCADGTRVRKAMQDLKVLSTEIRKEISEKKNAK